MPEGIQAIKKTPKKKIPVKGRPGTLAQERRLQAWKTQCQLRALLPRKGKT